MTRMRIDRVHLYILRDEAVQHRDQPPSPHILAQDEGRQTGQPEPLQGRDPQRVAVVGSQASVDLHRPWLAVWRDETPFMGLCDIGVAQAGIVGTGTRFGRMSSQMATFLDQAGGLWARGALNCKAGGTDWCHPSP